MLFWFIERPDLLAMERALLDLKESLKPSFDIEWRIIPASRLWSECVLLAKNQGKANYPHPDVIEFPTLWRESLHYLEILALRDQLNSPQQEQRWRALELQYGDETGDVKSTAHPALQLPWLVGPLLLYYRKDLLTAVEKTAQDMGTYQMWLGSMQSVREQTGWNGLKMPLDVSLSLWWLWSFGGEFIDPLNLMPAFCQAPAMTGLQAMAQSILEFQYGALAGKALPALGLRAGSLSEMSQEPFPSNYFSLFDFYIPRALYDEAAPIGVLPPPRGQLFDSAQQAREEPVFVVKEHALGITKYGLERRQEALLAALEAIAGDRPFLSLNLAKGFGMLPLNRARREDFYNFTASISFQNACELALARRRQAPRIRFLAPLDKVFSGALEMIVLQALAAAKLDTLRIAAVMARVASEYRLMVALYGLKNKQSGLPASTQPQQQTVLP